jgi:hypothetical protein
MVDIVEGIDIIVSRSFGQVLPVIEDASEELVFCYRCRRFEKVIVLHQVLT